MNRRNFLSMIGATALTPVMPAQIFAAGGIWSPDHCGFVGEYVNEYPMPSRFVGIADKASWAGMTTAQIYRDIDASFAALDPRDPNLIIMPDTVYHRFLYGDGTDRKSGLI